MSNMTGGVIYCDIPYRSRTKYQREFNHDEFWSWAEKHSKDNIVLVSELQAPDNWKSIWSGSIIYTINSNHSNATEHLYILSG